MIFYGFVEWVAAKPFQPRNESSLRPETTHKELIHQDGSAQYFNNNNCHNRSAVRYIHFLK